MLRMMKTTPSRQTEPPLLEWFDKLTTGKEGSFKAVPPTKRSSIKTLTDVSGYSR
jgi:hypothetical protein